MMVQIYTQHSTLAYPYRINGDKKFTTLTLTEILAKPSCSLQLLCKYFIIPNIVVCNGAPGKLYGFFELVPSDLLRYSQMVTDRVW